MSSSYGEYTTVDEVLDGRDLRGVRVFITGVSAGLGRETARGLIARGADVVGAASDRARAEAATAEIAEAGPGSLRIVELDLGSLASVRACTDRLLGEGSKIDVAIANAGVMACPEGKTHDGFETHFGINHLGHFLLVCGLGPLMKPGGRVVCLSSSAHRTAEIDLDDLNFERTPYNEWLAYGRSKTANALFAAELDRRWRDRGIRAASVHPGGISTNLDRHLPPGTMAKLAEEMDRQLAAEGKEPLRWKTIPQGAATTVWAAFVADADYIGGHYCEDCNVAVIDDEPSKMSGARPFLYDATLSSALWEASERLLNGT